MLKLLPPVLSASQQLDPNKSSGVHPWWAFAGFATMCPNTVLLYPLRKHLPTLHGVLSWWCCQSMLLAQQCACHSNYAQSVQTSRKCSVSWYSKAKGRAL